MDMHIDYYLDLIEDTTVDAEDMSYTIGANFTEIAKAMRLSGKDPAELPKRMRMIDMIENYEAIKKCLPDFDLGDYLTADFSDIQYYFKDLIEFGVSVDKIVRIWPDLLSFNQKMAYGVSPDVVFETEVDITPTQALRLLEAGGNSNKIARYCYLNTEQALKYHLDPEYVLGTAQTTEEMDLVRQNLRQLLEDGLNPEYFIQKENRFISDRSLLVGGRYAALENMIGVLPLLAEYAKDKAELHRVFFDYVEKLVYDDDWMAEDVEDMFLLDAMKASVKLGLIDFEDAVRYLCNIHDEYVDEDEDGRLIPGTSMLLNQDYVRDQLVS